MIGPEDVTAVALCGGAGRRVHGADKPLLEHEGRPLIAWIAGTVRQLDYPLLISANRHRAEYARFGEVVADLLEPFQGPLAGIAAALTQVHTTAVFVCPGDAPLLDARLPERLRESLNASGAEVACAHDGRRRQNLHLLFRTALGASLTNYLTAGQRSVSGWLDMQRCIDVDCRDLGDAFVDVDSPDALLALGRARNAQPPS